MLGTIAADSVLFVGRYFWTTSVTTPMTSDAMTAPGSERSRAATIAAIAADSSAVMPPGDSPFVGATRMPARPASAVLTVHTPSDTRPGLVPDRDAIASESTIARTRRPTSVSRRTTVPA